MSHELRTPLNAILLYCELLLDSAKRSGQAEDEQDLVRVRGAGNHLLTLINGLLDLAKIEAGRMVLHLEDVPLPQVLEDVVATVRPIAESGGNRLVVEMDRVPEVLRTEGTKLKQILFNLLSNACKFTKGGTVTLRVRGEGPSVHFEVEDTGIGMTQEQLGRIFQDFVQAEEETSRRYGGTGLGLTISRRLCELMGGQICVTSEAGKGTLFRVVLPLESQRPDTVHTAEGEASSHLVSAGGKPKALVVDGDPVHRDFLARRLVHEGYWVATAQGGEEGLALARRIRPKALVLELELAMAEGWSLLGRIQQDPLLGRLPVFLESLAPDGTRALAFLAPELLRLPFQSGALGPLFAGQRTPGAPGRALALCPDEEGRQALRSLAHRHGWMLDAEGQAEDLIALLRLRRPDLVLVDLQSGGSEAWTFFEAIQADPMWRGLRIVGLTLSDELGGAVASPWDSRRGGRSREDLADQLSALLRGGWVT